MSVRFVAVDGKTTVLTEEEFGTQLGRAIARAVRRGGDTAKPSKFNLSVQFHGRSEGDEIELSGLSIVDGSESWKSSTSKTEEPEKEFIDELKKI